MGDLLEENAKVRFFKSLTFVGRGGGDLVV